MLLLHGTASNVLGTFGGFTTEGDKTIWNDIKDKYGEHIYGVAHKTLTKSPLENAIMIMEALPENARIHLISGSRGGLVGEILSQSNVIGNIGFTAEEFSIFETLGRVESIEQMKTLNRLFIEKKYQNRAFRKSSFSCSRNIISFSKNQYLLQCYVEFNGFSSFFSCKSNL